MTLNPKLSVKSVASIKSFGALYKVDSNHDWLLPIDENNRRCKAAGYSGLKDYFIRKGLKLTKWKDTGLIKELVKPNGELMTFEREFSFFKVDDTRPDLKENELLRACPYSMKKTDTVLSPKRIRSLSPTLKHPTVKHLELTAEETDNKIKISQTSINVYYKMRKSKTFSILKYDKENNALPQERNHNPSNTRNAFPLVPGKSLMCLPKVTFTKSSEGDISGSVHSDSAVKQNALRESLSYRKFDRKNNSSAAKPSQKVEMRVTRKKCSNTNSRNSRDNNLSKPPSNKRSETQYSSLNVNITNKFVDVPPAGNSECNSDGSTTSTSISMFSASSSIYSFNDKKESVIRIDITSSGTESRSRKSPENVETRLLYTHAGEGCYNKNENCNSFSKVYNDQTNETQGENSKKTSNKSELKRVYLQSTKPADEVQKHSEQTPNSKSRIVKDSSDVQLSSEGANIPHESTQNDTKRNNNEKDCIESVVSTKESYSKADENCVSKACESCEETDAELEAVNIIYPVSAGITQKLLISNVTSEQLIPETTAVTLDYSDHNYTSLIDVRCTLKDVRCTLKDMRRSLEDCSETSQKEAVTECGVSERSDIEAKDDGITARLTKIENSEVDTLNGSCSDCKEKQHGAVEFETTNSNTVVIKIKDRDISYADETFQPVLLLDINHSRAVEGANSVHGVPMFKTNLPEQLFLKFEGNKSYSSVVIRKLIENPLLTQEIYNSLSSITPNICYHLEHSMGTKRMLVDKEHELYRTMEQRCPRSILQTEVSCKDTRTHTQRCFDETDECKLVRDDNLETQDMQAGISCNDTLTETRTEDDEIDDEYRCKISGDDVHEDNPETQNLQVDMYDKGEDSDELSVYEDALELL